MIKFDARSGDSPILEDKNETPSEQFVESSCCTGRDRVAAAQLHQQLDVREHTYGLKHQDVFRIIL